MADRNHLLLCLALGKDAAQRTEKLPSANAKEQVIVREAHRKGNVNSPGRS